MKYINVKEKVKEEDLLLIGMGDVHYGAKDCDIEKFEAQIEWIKSKKNARVILMGDLLDIGLKDSIGAGTFDNDFTPEDQIDYMIDKLTPIKDKIWCLLNGNHGERIRQRTSIDTDKLMAKALGVPYVMGGTFIRAKVNQQSYVIFATHGTSGSATPSGKLNAVMKLGSYIDADVIMMGHVHELMSHTTEYFRTDIKDKMVRKSKRNYVVTGHFLKYGGYAENKCMAPGKAGVAKIQLNTKKHDVHVNL